MTTNEDTTALIAEIESRREFYGGRYEEDSEIDLMFKAADRLAALTAPQEGSALAAIDRVRALHPEISGECHTCSNECGPLKFPCPTIAALDVVPEHEWEEVTQYGALTVRGEVQLEPRGRNYSQRQRTVRFGPWEPTTNEGVKP